MTAICDATPSRRTALQARLGSFRIHSRMAGVDEGALDPRLFQGAKSIGIYPRARSWLSSAALAVTEQDEKSLTSPRVKVFSTVRPAHPLKW